MLILEDDAQLTPSFPDGLEIIDGQVFRRGLVRACLPLPRRSRAVEELYHESIDKFCEVLAYHYRQSGNQVKAVEYLILSAKRAADRFANEEAMAFCEEALKILDQIAATEESQKMRKDLEFLLLGIKSISDEILPV